LIQYNHGFDRNCDKCGASVKSEIREGSAGESYWYECNCGNVWVVPDFEIIDYDDDDKW